MIQFTCPNCGKRFKLGREHAGRKGRCPSCRTVVQVPSASPDDSLQPPLPVEGKGSKTTPVAGGEPSTHAGKRSTLGTWSLVSGIVAIPIPGVEIAAVVLGVIGLNAAEDDSASDADRRKALVGIILGAAAFLLHLLVAITVLLLVFLLPQSRQQAAPSPTPRAAIVQSPVEVPPTPVTPPPTAVAPPPKRTGQVWYYDLNTGQLFTGKIEDVAPIDAPSGPLPDGGQAGVKAYVFSYGDCDDENQRVVGWLERASVNTKKVLTESKSDPQGAGGDLSIDDWIDVLATPLQISEDGSPWRGIHPMQYAQWQINKRKSMVNNGVQAKQCQP